MIKRINWYWQPLSIAISDIMCSIDNAITTNIIDADDNTDIIKVGEGAGEADIDVMNTTCNK